MKTRYTDRSILHLIFQVASSESAISFLSFFLTSQSAERLWIRETRSNAGTKNNAVRILPSSHGQSEWQRVTDRSTKPWNSYPLSWKQAYWREPLTPPSHYTDTHVSCGMYLQVFTQFRMCFYRWQWYDPTHWLRKHMQRSKFKCFNNEFNILVAYDTMRSKCSSVHFQV